MVLKMITEEVTGEKSPDMILFLATGMVVIIVLSFVRRIGTKVEQLKQAHEGRNDPKQNEVFLRQEEFGYVEGDGCQEDLFPADVFGDKVPKPAKEIGIAVVEIRIMLRTNMLVMFVVFGPKDFVGIEDEEGRANLPDGMIEFGVFRSDRSVHGIMSRDKQTRKEVHLNQHAY